MPIALHDGTRTYYETEGDGPPLVLYTGFTAMIEGWHDFGYVAALREEYRLILIDPLGQGASDKPHDPAAYSFEARVAALVAILDAEGIAAPHFWGYSEGGRMGIATARYAPHRLRSLIIGGYGVETPDPQARKRQAERLRADGPAALVAMWERALGGLPTTFRARLGESDVEALAASRDYYAGPYPDLMEGLSRIALPTLVYCGRADSYSNAQRLAAQIPDATFATMGNLDHLNGYAHSEAILPQVRVFLASVEGVSG